MNRAPQVPGWPRLGLLLAAGLVATGSQGCAADSRQPLILPQQSPYNLGCVPVLGPTPEAEAALAQPRAFTIQFSNNGEELLQLEAARLLGDVRCAFSAPRLLRATAEPHGKSALLLLGYRPAAVGTDTVMLELTSNAADFPVLLLPICGCAYDPARGDPPAVQDCATPSLEPNPACQLPPEPVPGEE